jgi:hypothetical protein
MENKEPKKISKQEADRMKSYAQGLNDEITHVVDYGEGLGDEGGVDSPSDYGTTVNDEPEK